MNNNEEMFKKNKDIKTNVIKNNHIEKYSKEHFDMNGSEKQKKWANEIRCKFIECFDSILNDSILEGEMEEDLKDYLERQIKFFNLIINLTDASFWILIKIHVGFDIDCKYIFEYAKRKSFLLKDKSPFQD